VVISEKLNTGARAGPEGEDSKYCGGQQQGVGEKVQEIPLPVFYLGNLVIRSRIVMSKRKK
jgi:hypothetical protein